MGRLHLIVSQPLVGSGEHLVGLGQTGEGLGAAPLLVWVQLESQLAVFGLELLLTRINSKKSDSPEKSLTNFSNTQ